MKIEKVLERENKKIIMMGSFLSLGTLSLSLSVNSNLSFLFCASIPFLVNETLNYINLKNNRSYVIENSFFLKHYKKSFNSEFKKYLESSNCAVEKKYKLLFTSILLKTKGLKATQLINLEEVYYQEIFQNMEQNKITQYSFENLYKEKMGDAFVDYDYFIEEDIDNKENIEIARKVYKDFEHMGLFGKNVQYWAMGQTKTLLFMQNYKLTSEDIKIIKEKVNDLKLDPNHIEKRDNIIFFLEKSTISSISKIADNDEKVESIEVLLSYFTELYKGNSYYKNIVERLSYALERNILEDSLPTKIAMNRKINKI